MNSRKRDLSSFDASEKAFFKMEFARIAVQERMIIKIGLYSFAAASIGCWSFYFITQILPFLFFRHNHPLRFHSFKFIVVINLILLFLCGSVFLIAYLGIRYKRQQMHELYEYSRLGNVKEDSEIMEKK